MNTIAMPKVLSLVALVLISGPFVAAQDSGWYVGGNIGQSLAKVDNPQITTNLLGAGFTITSIDDHNRDLGFKVFTGYEFNRYFSIEGGYFNLGKFDFVANTLPPGTLSGAMKVQGANLDAVFTLPITQKFSAFARAGVNYAYVRDTFSGTGEVGILQPAVSKNAANYKFGGGLQYDVTKRVALRAEVERYRISDPVGSKGDLDLASVGVLVRFGGHAPAASGPYIAPVADVIVVPAPDLVAPAPSKTQLYCTVLDLQFDIDQEAILPEDKEKLAVVGTFMTKYPDTTAVIEGHTDNVGSEEHNQKLSQGRADHVVAYLVGILHIAPNRLSAVGYGKANPQVSNATEEGKRQNRRIDAVIACATDIEGLQVASARVTLAMVMEFDQNKADVKPEYDGELRKVAKYMTANPKVTATVEGHTANLKGTPEQLLEVSKLRAQNVVEYLVNTLGVDRARLNAVGYGDDRRLAYNSSAEGKQENRRVNIVFNYPK